MSFHENNTYIFNVNETYGMVSDYTLGSNHNYAFLHSVFQFLKGADTLPQLLLGGSAIVLIYLVLKTFGERDSRWRQSHGHRQPSMSVGSAAAIR